MLHLDPAAAAVLTVFLTAIFPFAVGVAIAGPHAVGLDGEIPTTDAALLRYRLGWALSLLGAASFVIQLIIHMVP